MIKVYFGPKKHSPADELPADERFLWLRDMHLLKGFDRDFWTSNPLVLDQFQRNQIMLWSAGGWQSLELLAAELLPGFVESGALATFGPGHLALMCELVWEKQRLEAESLADQKTQP